MVVTFNEKIEKIDMLVADTTISKETRALLDILRDVMNEVNMVGGMVYDLHVDAFGEDDEEDDGLCPECREEQRKEEKE